MFSARADAFLRGCRARIGGLFDAGEKVLELNHSGGGEHEGWVISRHERRRSHYFVFIFFEEIEKGRPDLADAVHIVTLVLQSRLLAPRDSAFHAKKRGTIGPRCLRRCCRRATRCPLKHFPFERKSAPRSRLTDHNRRSLYIGHSLHSEAPCQHTLANSRDVATNQMPRRRRALIGCERRRDQRQRKCARLKTLWNALVCGRRLIGGWIGQ